MIISQKLERLLAGYFDQIIDQPNYCLQKSKLLLQKESLQEKMISLSHKQNDWLEPMKEWIEDAQTLDGIAGDTDLLAKRSVPKKSLA